MRLDVFKTLWGAVGAGSPYPTFREAIPVIAAQGFDGVAFALIARTFDPGIGELEELRELCDEHGLEIATLVMSEGATVEDHVASLRSDVEAAAPLRSRHLMAHGGADWFDDDQATRFFREVLAMERDLGLTVGHETHRTRILYNPWTTARMLDRFEDLQLTIDFSHWVVVAERLIDDQIDIVRQAAERAVHVDARVGSTQAIQVADPAASDQAETLEGYLRWWHLVWDAQEQRGMGVSTVVPEFGPPPYQPTLPGGAPITDLWGVCGWMADRLRTEFASRF
jgi:sugar phosphate isomerase/epimerase